MIRRLWRTATKRLASAGLTIGLLVFVGAWSSLATVIAQGSPASPDVAAWSVSHPALEPIVAFLGLHRAFTAPPFLVAVIVLALSTAVCSWRRTIVARHRAGVLRTARRSGDGGTVGGTTLEVPLDASARTSEVFAVTAGVLKRLGIRLVWRDERLIGASAPWSVWGSAVFHWALVALIALALLGALVRSESSMPLAVGETKPVVAQSDPASPSGQTSAAGDHERSIRVDAFDPDYRVGGIARGAVPTVSLLDEAGDVVASQRVFQNNMLHSGSLSVYSPECGLAVRLAFLDQGGEKTADDIRYVGFSQGAPQGTVPIGALTRRDMAGVVRTRLSVTVPLDRAGDGFGEWIPKVPTARVNVTDAAGTPLLDTVLRPGESVALPGGEAVRLEDIGWFAWLTLVDDPTIPFVYAAMIIALMGLTLTLAARQHLVVAVVRSDELGLSLVVELRLWRNVPTTCDEIESELKRALHIDPDGSTA